MRMEVKCDRRAGTWVVKGGGETHSFGTRKQVVDRAVAAAKGARNAQVVIRTMDGKIQSERTYGNDLRKGIARSSSPCCW
jgi:hypothetical protein